MIVPHNWNEAVEAEDVEERGPLADRLLFWLLKHPYQRVSEMAFVFHADPSTIARQLHQLTKEALVESLTSAIATSTRPEALYYLTSAGIERVADLVGGMDPTTLARMWQANEAALLHRIPRLASELALQDAVFRLIADAPRQLAYPGGYPAAIRWHWQHEYVHAFERKQRRMTFRADGVVVFRRRPLRQNMQHDSVESWSCFFWFIDPGLRGSEDLRLMRTRIEQLLFWRESSERWSFYQAFPPLLILASTAHQRDLWISAAQEAAAHLRVAPLKGAGAVPRDDSPWKWRWHHLDGSGGATLHTLVDPIVPQAIPPGLLAPRHLEPGTGRKGKGNQNVVIGHFETRAQLLETKEDNRNSMTAISLLSLRLSRRHTDLLQQIYAAPLIAPRELAALLQMEAATVQRYLHDLQWLQCLEMIATSCEKRIVLTETGLRLMAALLGVHLIHLAKRNGSTQRWQQRGSGYALHTIEHTAGIYRFLAKLQTQAKKLGQEVLWWETTRSFRRYHVQGAWQNLMPDALFAYQAKDAHVEAWLEWDTGSMHLKPMAVKFTSYAQYVRSQQYRQEHRTPPKLLLVAPQNGREQSLRTVAASVLGSLPLTIWTTTEPLLNVQGPLGAIWKPLKPGGAIDEEGTRSQWVES